MRNKPCISALKTWLSSAFLLLSLFFVQVANAADFTWNVRNTTSPQFKTWQDACVEASKYLGGPWPVIGTAPPYTSTDTFVYCYWDRGAEGTYYNPTEGFVRRQGDSCPTGTNWNSVTRKCEGDPCIPTAGQKISHEVDKGKIGAGGSSEPPGSVCQNSCQYVFTYNVKNCYRYVEAVDGKNMDNAYCSYEYSGNGMSCTSNAPPVGSVFDQPATKPPSSPQQEYFKDNDCENWVTNADGTRTRSCLSQEFFKNPGNMSCTTTGGTLSCTAGSPSPYLKDQKTETTIAETSNPDGSKSTSTGSTTTTTTCKGASPCTTTTKNEGKDTTTNPDGTEGDTTETCEGDGCNPEEEDKEEEEECDPLTDPNKCGQSSVSGEACDASIDCSGDAIQCAILRQQKLQQCADKEFREVTPEKVTELKNTLNSEFSGDSYQPLVADSSNTFDFANTIDTSSRFSKSCPVVPDISTPWFEGQTLTIEFSDMISQFCDFLIWFGYLLVAFAMRAAAQIIANGMN